jgi:16S rRNA processing protein RimM
MAQHIRPLASSSAQTNVPDVYPEPHHTEPMLRIGRIAGAHGLKGALRLRPDNPDSDTLEHLSRVFVESLGTTREYQLTGVTRLSPGTLRLVLAGVCDADEADALRGATLMVAIADLPAPGPSQFYYFQALGCEVFSVNGERLGTIEETFSNGAHDVWRVRSGEREVLVPVISEVVIAMDFEARRITIEPPAGLLD